MIAPSTDNFGSETATLPRPVLRLVRDDAKAAALAAWPVFGGSVADHPPPLNLGGLLGVLDFKADEFVSICHKIPGGRFVASVCATADVTTTLAGLPNGADVWFGVNPTTGPTRTNAGRGADAEVTRLSSLYADLDIGEGKCASREVAESIIAELSEILGTDPVAVTDSGGGLHPYWPLADAHLPPGRNGTYFKPLLSRWKRLVQQIAKKHGAKVDSVFDPARVLRVPGTFNRKPEAQGKPAIPVTCSMRQDHTLTSANVVDALDAYGIRDIADYPADDSVKSDPDTWEFGAQTCSYAQAMIRGWTDPDTVDIGTGRHPWLLKQATRLFCALSGGCITADDFEHAKTVLNKTFVHLLATRQPIRQLGTGEVLDALTFGVAKAATKTKAQARAELGDHEHDQPAKRSQATVLVDLAKELYRFGVTDEGKAFFYKRRQPACRD
ncbi:hypothetical protein [Mycobacterium kansasii]|uniref:hypothetical protein n=2 Tax=Mycobacterium kansasii TaxID=1768 RepID=UPI001157E44F|nr:hypothetical protein [Mycobacterium kansasii]